jgi:hypothetical protein
LEAGSKTSFCLILNDLDLDSFELQQDYTVNVNLTYLPSDDTTGYIPENYDFKFGAVNMDRGNYHTGHSFRRSGGSIAAAVEYSSQKRWIKYGRLLLSVSI